MRVSTRYVWRKAIVTCMASATVIVATTSTLGALTRPMNYPTASQISAQLARGALSNHIPDGEILPGIGTQGQLDFLVPHPRWSECAVMGPRITITKTTIAHCTFGERSARVTIGIYGDSNAAMWVPAFDIYGALHHRRIIALAHMGCTAWSKPWVKSKAAPGGAISEGDCANWRRNVLSAFRRAKVEYVLPISIDPSGVHDGIDVTKLTKTVAANFVQIRHYGLKPFVLAPVPRYTYKTDYLNCVSAHPNTLRGCMIHTSSVSANRLNRAFASASRSRSVPEVATQDLFCDTQRCPLFVSWEGRSIQIRHDGQHITGAYAQLIAGALAPRISTALSQAR